MLFAGKTYAIELPAGSMLPKLLPAEITAANVATLPVMKTYDAAVWLYFGDDLSQYTFVRETTHRNIYRIPLP